jgi:hypothetical protein
LEDIEEWNEFGELKENIGPVPANNAAPPGGQTGVNIAPPLPVNPTATAGTTTLSETSVASGGSKAPAPLLDESKAKPVPLPGAAEIAARNSNSAPMAASTIDDLPKPETMSSPPEEKKESLNAAKEALKAHPNVEHLSAPASRLHSGTATPAEAETEVKQSETEVTSQPAEGGIVAATEVVDKATAEKGIEALHLGDADKTEEQSGTADEDITASVSDRTQEQSAKAGEDATKSVED